MIDVQLSYVSAEVLQEKARVLTQELKHLSENQLLPEAVSYTDPCDLETAIEKTKTELDLVIDEILRRREKRIK